MNLNGQITLQENTYVVEYTIQDLRYMKNEELLEKHLND